MTRRNIHYEAAFENYLRGRGCPYLAVDESKRAIFSASAVKSFDFLVYSSTGPNLLVDIKGRKFPDPAAGPRRNSTKAWDNWITREDGDALRQWGGVFGPDTQPTLVFAYWLQGPPRRSPFEDVHVFGPKDRRRHYAFMSVGLEEYVQVAHPRSVKWQTITVPAKTFAELVCDVSELL